MNNMTEYNEFTRKGKSINESSRLVGNNWNVRIEVSSAIVNSFIKKVKDENGEDLRKTMGEQDVAEEIAKYATQFLTIENLPTSLIMGDAITPKTQVQGDMAAQTQVQGDVAQPVQTTDTTAQPAPVQPAAPAAQGTAPAPAPAQNAQAAATQINQTEI